MSRRLGAVLVPLMAATLLPLDTLGNLPPGGSPASKPVSGQAAGGLLKTGGLTKGSSPYSSDTNKDGVVDADDPCPTAVSGTPGINTSPRNPECYLGFRSTEAVKSSKAVPWMPSDMVGQFGISGALWQKSNCEPLMAVPVKDKSPSGKLRRGVVFVGTQPIGDLAKYQDLLNQVTKPGGTWPPSLGAWCLVSVDYDTATSMPPLLIQAPNLASFYALWKAPQKSVDFAPDDTLGLPLENVVAEVRTRVPQEPKLNRLKFSRGVVYGANLHSTITDQTFECPAEGPSGGLTLQNVQDLLCDLTKKTKFKNCRLDAPPDLGGCKQVSLSAAKWPLDWRVIPTALQTAIEDLQQQEQKAFLTPSVFLSPDLAQFLASIEGIPKDLSGDDRGLKKGKTAHVLGSGAVIVPPSINGGTKWLIVPEAIGHPMKSVTSPLGPAAMSSRVGNAILVQQTFIVDGVTRTVEVQWPIWPPALAYAESTSQWGTRWASNGAPNCWASLNGVPVNSTGSDSIARAWCPAEQYAFISQQPAVWDQNYVESTTCAPFNANKDKLTGEVKPLVPQYQEECIAEAGGGKYASCCAANAVSAYFGGPVVCGCECSPAGMEIGACTFKKLAGYISPKIKPDQQWVDIGTPAQPLAAMVGILRGGDKAVCGEIPGSIRSEMTAGGDSVTGLAHQGTDWNWVVEKDNLEAVDPNYRNLSVRRTAPSQWEYLGIENELEFQIPRGMWTQNPHAPGNIITHGVSMCTYVTAGGNLDSPDPKTVNAAEEMAQWLGQNWPSDYCREFGVEYNFYAPSGNQECMPSASCGQQPGQLVTSPNPAPNVPGYWRTHYGRGLFGQINQGTVAGEQSKMVLNPAWPEEPNTGGFALLGVAAGVHRIGFLGRPIVDCGHAPFRVEIHPPHLVMMDTRAVSLGAGVTGSEFAVFGWMNNSIPETIEFDLWPVEGRPSPSAELVAYGHDVKLNHIGQGAAFSDFGYVIDVNQVQSSGKSPLLSCARVPAQFPNHVHCAYTDLNGGIRSPKSAPGAYGNPRMTPYFATSRFDLRAFVGWKK